MNTHIRQDLTIKEISEYKEEAEKKIASILRDLEQITGLEVVRVDVNSVYDDVPARKLVKHALIINEPIDV